MNKSELKNELIKFQEYYNKIYEYDEAIIHDIDITVYLQNIEETEEKSCKKCNLQSVSCSLPSDEEFETALEREAFRVPYDGSNNFYDEPMLKHWRKCWKWVKNAVTKHPNLNQTK